jgi:SEC-C motif-containing protein
MKLCACGSQKKVEACCKRFIDGVAIPTTPEELMRSRYTAFTQINIDYICHTMKGLAAAGFDVEDAKRWAESVEWLGLEVVNTFMEEEKGFVEFLAHFKQNGKRQILHELSEFHFENGIWYYVDGSVPKKIPLILPMTRVGRNDLCNCGSGKKHKKCCAKST